VNDASIQLRFTAALDALVEQVRRDRSVAAAILCGSLSHDTVWKKSDIDLVLVTVDDRKLDSPGLALYADGINVHAYLMPRAEFRKTVEGATHNSFAHSLLAKGRLLYTHDRTIADLCARLHALGSRDAAIQLLRAGTHALPLIDKAHKWYLTRGDLDYAALWILYAATPLAQIEVIGAGLIADREVIPQATALNPAFFKTIYSGLLNGPKTRAAVQGALDAVDGYISRRARALFAEVFDYLRDAGDTRSATEIADYFAKNLGVDGVTTACEYLADEGLIGKGSSPVHLTRRSNVEVQELAFYFIGEPAHAR
jgi:predicted nucleotidyltransferase